MKNQTTLWYKLCMYINLYKDTDFITRQDIILYLQNIGALGKHSHGTVWVRSTDIYRRYLTKAGYLEDTNTRGVYKKIKSVPLFTLSMNQIRKEAYQKIE